MNRNSNRFQRQGFIILVICSAMMLGIKKIFKYEGDGIRKKSNTNALIARLICSLIAILLVGCQNSEEKRLSIKNNFWYSYEYDAKSDSYRITNYGYKFHDNEVDIMSYDFDKNEMSEIIIDDIYIPKEWYSSKRTLHFKGDDFDILYHNQDTLLLQIPSIRKRLLLINCGEVNPEHVPQSYRIKNAK